MAANDAHSRRESSRTAPLNVEYDMVDDLLSYDWKEATNHPDFKPLLMSPAAVEAARQRDERTAPPLSWTQQRDHGIRNVDPGLGSRTSLQHAAELRGDVPWFGARPFQTQREQRDYLPVGAPMAPVERFIHPGEPQKDAAAAMLQTLQSKLDGIQASVKALPRTGYAAYQRGAVPASAPPACSSVCEAVCEANKLPDDVLDEEFLALVSCSMESSRQAGLKRKAEEVLDLQELREGQFVDTQVVGESKLDLKTRNRQSAKASRERKKAHLDRLLKQVDDLTSHNLELADVCEELVKDNAGLKAELEKLGCKFDQHGKAILPEGHSLSAIDAATPAVTV